MMIGVLGSLADYERELIKERIALKRAVSRANGTKFGRPRKVDDAEHIAADSLIVQTKGAGISGWCRRYCAQAGPFTAQRMKADGQYSPGDCQVSRC
jgi:DNA invertase Pin-like site-specific DNA recombinase